jgi:hypothetical protein
MKADVITKSGILHNEYILQIVVMEIQQVQDQLRVLVAIVESYVTSVAVVELLLD